MKIFRNFCKEVAKGIPVILLAILGWTLLCVYGFNLRKDLDRRARVININLIPQFEEKEAAGDVANLSVILDVLEHEAGVGIRHVFRDDLGLPPATTEEDGDWLDTYRKRYYHLCEKQRVKSFVTVDGS